MKPLLQVKNLSKSFHRSGTPTVNNMSFELQSGQIVALLGPSGCGKTTTLRLIAGFERPDSGSISLEDSVLYGAGIDLPPERRGIGFVFQDYALFPHLSVLENVTFGLSSLNKTQRLARAREVLGMVGLLVFQDRLPSQLSGGQQQRVALARALAPRPKLILLDEPFSSLDANLRASTRLEVRRILEAFGATALLVTHDQEEAMSFADRVIVMRDGHIEQDGTPESVYGQPRTAFVANFLGRTNLIPARASGSVASSVLGVIALKTPENGPVMLSVRPESLKLGDSGLAAAVVAREFKGHDLTYTLEAGNVQLVVQTDVSQVLEVGELTFVKLVGDAVVVRGSEKSSV
jgi:iron(III) transport system ATP-binding protein